MLKLRKNKKGFTLVELIVVIAIMAVLAGTVAGVTVSQLNKNTDKANYTQANKIATSISGLILESPEKYINVATGAASEGGQQDTENQEDAATQPDTFILETSNGSKDGAVDLLLAELAKEFTGKTIASTAPAAGEFQVSLIQNNTLILVTFGAKTKDYKDKGYTISTEGVVAPYSKPKN